MNELYFRNKKRLGNILRKEGAPEQLIQNTLKYFEDLEQKYDDGEDWEDGSCLILDIMLSQGLIELFCLDGVIVIKFEKNKEYELFFCKEKDLVEININNDDFFEKLHEIDALIDEERIVKEIKRNS